MTIWGYIVWLWRAAEGIRLRLLTQVVTGVAHVGFSLCYVWTSKRLVDIATSREEGNLWLFIALMLGCLAMQILLSSFVSRMEIESELSLRNHLRHHLFSHLMDSRFFTKQHLHTGDMMNRLLEDVDNISNTLCVITPQTIVTTLQFVSALTFLALLDYRLAVVVALILPLFVLFSRIYAHSIRQFTGQIREMDSQVQSHIQEYMHHRTLVASMEQTPRVVEDLQSMQNNLRDKVMTRTGLTLFSRKLMQTGFSVGYMTAFVWGVFALRSGAGYGVMTAFMQLAGQIQRPMMELSRQVPNFIHLLTAIDRVSEIIALPREERGESIDLGAGVGIRLSNSTFGYDDNKAIINGLSYDFKPHTITAIMGHTGVGKSTLMRMVLGLISPSDGLCEFYNSTLVATASPRTRCNIAYVPQGNSLINGTIRSNLLLGNADASEEQLREALHAAVADFVFDLPQGLDTRCGEAGDGLSEGQAQRIAIARGLLRKGAVLLMDEPTSSLDSSTEELLLQRLTTHAKGRTIIIVTHRPIPAKYCDTVMNLEIA